MSKYWHFCSKDRRLGHGDGRLIEVGKTLTVDCEPVLCESGLHASKRLIDALAHASGPILCEVKLGGTVIHDTDKSVATERTVIRMADATDVVRDFARRCALDVVHLWDAPDVVIQYLKTGDESLWSAAVAGVDAAMSGADAAMSGGAAINAAAAAMAAARSAARAAAMSGGGAAAGAAATWDAARESQNRRLTQMIRQLNWETDDE